MVPADAASTYSVIIGFGFLGREKNVLQYVVYV